MNPTTRSTLHADALSRLNKNHATRRSFLRLCATLPVVGALAACSPSLPAFFNRSVSNPSNLADENESTVPDLEVVQLVYQDWRTDWFPAMVEDMLELFHEENPNIRIFFTPDPPNLEEDMLANMMAGTAPDLFQGCCTFFPIWAQHNFTLDLQPWVELHLEPAKIRQWDAAQYDALTLPNGHRFGLPKYHGSLALYYNKDIFDEAAVPYPDASWGYAEYAAAMAELTQDRSGNGTTDLWGSMIDVSWDRIQVHVNGWGGYLVDANQPGKCGFADPRTLDAVEWLHTRMWVDKVMATRLDVQNMATRSAFINQKVAMVEEGSWALKDILTSANFNIGVAPFPHGPQKHVTLATTDGFGIYQGTNHTDEAWSLMQFLISEEYGRAMASANFLQPALSSLVDEWIEIIRQEFPSKTDELNLAAFADGHRNDYSVTIEVGAQMAEIQSKANTMWEHILTFGDKPVKSLESVCL